MTFDAEPTNHDDTLMTPEAFALLGGGLIAYVKPIHVKGDVQ